MLLRQIFDPYLAQYAYLIGCQRTGEALVIDPERDIDQYRNLAAANGLRITAVAETHIHADFVSGGREFAGDPAVHLYLSAEGGPDWTYQWPHGRRNTHLLRDGEAFFVGNIRIEAVHSPGHTPEHLSFLITDVGGGADEPMLLATGDFVFVGDVGRPALLETAAGVKGVMEPSARQLRASLTGKLAPLADYLQILPAHGAGSACGKALGAVPTTTLGYERRFNGALKLAVSDEEAFVRGILAGQPEPPPYFATMKRVNRDGVAVTGGPPHAAHLGAGAFRKAWEGGDGIRILDARDDRAAFDDAHVPRAIHAPLHSPFFSTAAGSYLVPEDRILLVVESAADVDLAVRQLYRIGLDNVAGWITVPEAEAAGLLAAKLSRLDFPDFDPEKARSDGRILDVRTDAEFQQGHVAGALSIPYTRLRVRRHEVPRDRRLYVHCGSGKRAALAASYLQAEGFDVVHVDGICAACEQIAQREGVSH
ncbi:MAG TPA: MBL fold metallo-hydrolase [Terrimicrobiaceae bacterium]|nr:MBL fold metallo-hydrolase [Terrimicrobiaceae bacterium]